MSMKGVAGVVLAAMVTVACEGPQERAGERAGAIKVPDIILVGSLEAPESQILGQMFIRILEDADYEADSAPAAPSTGDLVTSLEAGEIHMAPLYLASLAEELGAPVSGDPAELRAAVQPLLEDLGLAILDPAPMTSGPAVVVPRETADKLKLATVSDLADGAGDLTLAGPPDCQEEAWCLDGLRDVYGVEVRRFHATSDPADALEGGQADAAILPATSAKVREERWVVLEDDRLLFPAESPTPVVRQEVLAPEIASMLNAVSATLNAGEVTVYNRALELGESPGTVAVLHLYNERLLGGASAGEEVRLGTQPPAGCEDAKGPEVVEVVALDRAFDTGCLIVSPDQRIALVNQDSLPHTFTIAEDTTYRPPFLLDLDESLGKRTVTSGPIGESLESGGRPFVCRYHIWMAGQIWVE
jgi:osmoprotectant transport system substrate-binding protein